MCVCLLFFSCLSVPRPQLHPRPLLPIIRCWTLRYRRSGFVSACKGSWSTSGESWPCWTTRCMGRCAFRTCRGEKNRLDRGEIFFFFFTCTYVCIRMGLHVQNVGRRRTGGLIFVPPQHPTYPAHERKVSRCVCPSFPFHNSGSGCAGLNSKNYAGMTYDAITMEYYCTRCSMSAYNPPAPPPLR